MTDLSPADRLRLYAKMGMRIEVTPEQAITLAELLDAAEDAAAYAEYVATFAERVNRLVNGTVTALVATALFGLLIAVLAMI